MHIRLLRQRAEFKVFSPGESITMGECAGNGNGLEAIADLEQGVSGADMESNLLANTLQSEGNGTKKRIVWALDFDKAREFLDASKDSTIGGLQAELDLVEAPVLLGRHPVTRIHSTASGASTTAYVCPKKEMSLYQSVAMGLDKREHSDFSVCGGVPAYPHGSKVEYYSQTGHRWVVGTISLSFSPASDSDSTSSADSVIYNVFVGTSHTLRRHVSLCSLRAPLRGGEPVEMFSIHPITLQTTWRNVVMHGHQSPGSTTIGYKVMLDDRVISGVPAHFLRRRFEPECEIERYCRAVGWTHAVVGPVGEMKHDEKPRFIGPVQGTNYAPGAMTQLAVFKGSEEHTDLDLVHSYLLRARQLPALENGVDGKTDVAVVIDIGDARDSERLQVSL